MNSRPCKIIVGAVLASAALLGTSRTHAEVVFDDGKMHVISDATYALERIVVRNHTKVKLVEGAVIAAPIEPAYDFDSGLPVLEFSAAAIQVFDHSMVIVQGGEFGGEPLGTTPEFLDNWHSGSIAAFDQSKVIVQDGTFGAGAFRSGMLAVFDEALLMISGGTFTNAAGNGGRIELYGMSDARISGGHHGSTIVPSDHSHLGISGGRFGKDDTGFRRGAVLASGSSTVRISGGTFGGNGMWHGVVAVGDLLDGSEWFGNPLVVIEGGDFGGSGFLSGQIQLTKPQGRIEIKGSEFNFPFGVVEGTANPFSGAPTWLTGELSSGEEIETTIWNVAESDDAVIELIED